MICDFCRSTVLESGKTWGYHHDDPVDFDASVEAGCVFCTRLAERLGEEPDKRPDEKTSEKPSEKPSETPSTVAPWFDQVGDTKSLYRWNMRPAARIRETKSYVSITFRPVAGRSVGPRRSEDLPEVRFDLIPEDDLGAIPDADELGAGTGSEQSQARMRQWLEDCVDNHPKCVRSHGSRDFVPTRVLDVGPGDAAWPPARIRVVNTRRDPIRAPYLTLSHCWGRGSFVRLTTQTLDEYTGPGIPWEAVCSNANFAQAVHTVRRLGMRYVWIDSVCIIQGVGAKGPHVDDWAAEAPLMHKVYRNSYCNIAAADSRDHTGGLFRERTPGILPVRYTPARPSTAFGDRVWRVLNSDLWDRDLMGSELYTRGWVFQERMLSPRLLQFGAAQLFWDCATLSATETLPAGLPAPLDAAPRTDRHWRERLQGSALSVRPLAGTAGDSLEAFWRAAVRAYTACALTFYGDKLAAVWGVAKLVRDALGEEYAAGLWSNSLHEQLAWRAADCAASGRPAPATAAAGFPSWSWASLRGAVDVAPRVPAVPRFYAAAGHGGGQVRFRVRTPLFGRHQGEHSAVWSEEVVNMTRRLDEAAARVSRKAKAGVVTTIAPIPEEPPAAAPPATEEEKRVFAADRPPELVEDAIPVQAHVCAGTLRAAAEKGRWVFAVEGGGQDEALFEAYPDTLPPSDETPCELVLLAASKMLMDEWGDWSIDEGCLEEDEIYDVHYSGAGILVERAGDDRFRRVGAVAFREVGGDSWERLRRACGQGDEMLEDELDVEDGRKIWLV